MGKSTASTPKGQAIEQRTWDSEERRTERAAKAAERQTYPFITEPKELEQLVFDVIAHRPYRHEVVKEWGRKYGEQCRENGEPETDQQRQDLAGLARRALRLWPSCGGVPAELLPQLGHDEAHNRRRQTTDEEIQGAVSALLDQHRIEEKPNEMWQAWDGTSKETLVYRVKPQPAETPKTGEHEADDVGTPGNADSADEDKKAVPQRARTAYQQFQQAADALGETKPTDRDAYDQLTKAYKSAGEADELPEFDTWTRNLRLYRRPTGTQKYTPRDGRADSAGSVVNQSDL